MLVRVRLKNLGGFPAVTEEKICAWWKIAATHINEGRKKKKKLSCENFGEIGFQSWVVYSRDV